MKSPKIIVHECEAYFYKTAETNQWKKFSISIMSQYSEYWVNSKEPFIIYEYGTNKQIDPATLQGNRLSGQIMVEVIEQKNRTCHKMIALQIHPRTWSPDSRFDENPFMTFPDYED